MWIYPEIQTLADVPAYNDNWQAWMSTHNLGFCFEDRCALFMLQFFMRGGASAADNRKTHIVSHLDEHKNN